MKKLAIEKLAIELNEGDIVKRRDGSCVKISGSSHLKPIQGSDRIWTTKLAWPCKHLDENLHEDGGVGEIHFSTHRKVEIVTEIIKP